MVIVLLLGLVAIHLVVGVGVGIVVVLGAVLAGGRGPRRCRLGLLVVHDDI